MGAERDRKEEREGERGKRRSGSLSSTANGAKTKKKKKHREIGFVCNWEEATGVNTGMSAHARIPDLHNKRLRKIFAGGEEPRQLFHLSTHQVSPSRRGESLECLGQLWELPRQFSLQERGLFLGKREPTHKPLGARGRIYELR